MPGKAFSLEILKDKIGLLTFDVRSSKVNIFTAEVMTELESILLQLRQRKDLNALLLMSGKEAHFCAGADMHILAALHDPETGYQLARKGQQIFSLFTELPFPAVAVINGICVGGGTELTLACHYRLASDHPKTKLALPEVTIGLIPGWGGTQRLPRLIGVQRSLDFILTGRRLDAQRAYQLGLVDHIIAHEAVLPDALNFVESLVSGKKDQLRYSHRARRTLLDRLPLGKQLLYFLAKRAIARRTMGNYPAPQLALAAMRSGLKKSLNKGLEIEASYFKQMVGSPVSKNLIRVFFWHDAIKKENERMLSGTKLPEVSRAAVVGAGLMGGDIARMLAAREISVSLKAVREKSLAKAKQRIAFKSDKRSNNITYTLSYNGFTEFPFVIESITEDLTAKQQLLTELEKQVDDDTVIATNTSSFCVNALAKALQKPERFIAMHFFNPTHRTQLVEIIRSTRTSDKTVATAIGLARQLGKTPMVIRDSPGFLVNRILAPFLLEALILLTEGMDLKNIDRLMRKFGLPAGPFEMFDTIGLDIALAVAKNLAAGREADSKLYLPSLETVVASGYLGKKAGQGFYRYMKKHKRCNRKITALMPKERRQNLAQTTLIQRLLYPMINEAARCLAEQIVRQPRDIDAALIFSIGFAPFRGGLLTYADNEGIGHIVDILEAFTQRYGQRFQPAGLLYTLRDQGKRFYS
jgi:3-hydroxyacyl-CoA dehydrogenase/enoyl-CoA hydratase/3-hydroxybutyryl-CoA epimerase